MTILALTENPFKQAEYREQFALYGVGKSLDFSPMLSADEIASWLKAQGDENSFVFREESDLFEDSEALPPKALPRPYRRAELAGRKVMNRSKATVWRLDAHGDLAACNYFSAIPGKLVDTTKLREDTCFDWDDVFQPDQQSNSYQEAKLVQGKCSARNLILDEIIMENLPFRSSRAFKYGRFNSRGMIDLNHFPINPARPIQFDYLPFDFLQENPIFSASGVADSPIVNLFRNAVAKGAHFRAAHDRRSWLYWAPGINAGIPLTPKEDAAAEMIYLGHDFAHYVLPDLIVDHAPDPLLDMVTVAHRMLGETMAMVAADMFLMDTFQKNGVVSDAGKHGIHPILRLSGLADLPQDKAFDRAFEIATHALLLGDDSKLREVLPQTEEAEQLISRFMAKYTKFALADYEWTWRNLQEMQLHGARQSRWTGMLNPRLRKELGLQTVQEVVEKTPALQNCSDLREVILTLRENLTDCVILPMMRRRFEHSRSNVLSASLQRYLAGQLALYARYPDFAEESRTPEKILDALGTDRLYPEEGEKLERVILNDLDRMFDQKLITIMDHRAYQTAFPIVRPHYVSYANPRYPDHQAVFDLFPAQEKSLECRP